jgi:hypothetical protein
MRLARYLGSKMRETTVSVLTFLHLYKIAHVYEILIVEGVWCAVTGSRY